MFDWVLNTPLNVVLNVLKVNNKDTRMASFVVNSEPPVLWRVAGNLLL